MRFASSSGTTVVHVVLAGLIALGASACAAPNSDPVGAYQAGGLAMQGAQLPPAPTRPITRPTPADPVQAIDDTMEDRLDFMIDAARHGISAYY
jgi:hypothetical protein